MEKMSKLARVRRNRIALISIAAPFAIASVVVGYIFLRHNQLRTDPVEISKQSPVVQSFLEAHPNARLDTLARGCFMSDGYFFMVDENWNPVTRWDYYGTFTAFDGEDHFCWMVKWRAPYEPGIPNAIWVFVDRDTLDILYVEKGIDM